MAAKKKKVAKKALKKTAKKVVKAAARKAAPKRQKRAEPQSFRARSSHAAFTVNDLAKSIAFYVNGLGFTVKEEWKKDGKVDGVELRAGAIEHYITQDDGAKGWDRKKGVACSFTFTTAQNVDDVAERLEKAGYSLLIGPVDMPWGARAFRVTDPDGFIITIST